MSISLLDGKKVLIETIQKDLRHQDYKRVCEIAEMYTAFVTGEEVGKLLKQFTPREDDVQFAQRVNLTQVITDYIAYRLMNPMFKVPRTVVTQIIEWSKKDKAEEWKKILQKAMDVYAGDECLDDYLATALVLMDSTDPNGFIVTDFEGEVDPTNPSVKPEPYPFEVNSHEAIDYKKKNNKLQYLTVLNEIKGMKRFTMYLKDEALIAQQISEEEYSKSLTLKKGDEIIFKDPDKKSADEIYILRVASHKAGRIPAIQIGTKKDLKTRKRTYVPLIHAARPFFMKSIKTISEFDLTNTLHVFPQKFIYGNVCPGDLTKQIICMDGKNPGTGTACSICKGTGFVDHKSSQDVVIVKMPNDLKDVVSLENFAAYKHPPTEILDFLKKLGLYELPDLAVKAVYSSELFTADNITTTATEKNIDLESVYDTLKPFANKFSAVWIHIMEVMAAYLDVNSDITINHMFPNDFKMKSVTMLIEDLGKANSSGAPSYIKKEINRDIAQKLYIDKPYEIMKLNVQELFDPFNGKSESEISTIINNNLTTKFNQILYANFSQIFSELEQENTTDTVFFYKMERSLQKDLLDAKVEEYIAAIEEENAGARVINFSETSAAAPDAAAGGAA